MRLFKHQYVALVNGKRDVTQSLRQQIGADAGANRAFGLRHGEFQKLHDAQEAPGHDARRNFSTGLVEPDAGKTHGYAQWLPLRILPGCHNPSGVST